MKRKSTVLIFALLCMILLCANAHAASYTLSTGGVITVENGVLTKYTGTALTAQIPDTLGIHTIGMRAFAGNTALTSVSIPSGVKLIGVSAFAGCTALKQVSLPNTLRTIEDKAFIECGSLTDITLPDGTETVGQSAFLDAGLQHAQVPCSVTSISYEVFEGCPIGHFTCDLGSTFANILISKQDGNSITWRDATIESGLLKSYTGNGTNLDLLKYVNDGTYGCENYTITGIGNQAFEKRTSLEEIRLPMSLKSIGAHAFSGCSNLEAVTFPSSLQVIRENAFQNCVSLFEVTIPDSVTKIGEYAFDNAGIGNATVPGSVTDIKWNAFEGSSFTSFTTDFCSTIDKYLVEQGFSDSVEYRDAQIDFDGSVRVLTGYTGTKESLDIPRGSAYPLVKIGEGVFRDNETLKSITIPEGVTEIGDQAFYGCVNLASVTLPTTIRTFGNVAFGSTPALKSITIPEGVEEIGANSFIGAGIQTIKLPSTLREIGKMAFYLTKLKSVTLPSGLKIIGEGAFLGCELSSVTIPASVEEVQKQAFYCDKLETVTVEGENTILADDTLLPLAVKTVRCCLASSAHEWAIRHYKTVELLDAEISVNDGLVKYTGTRSALWIPEEMGLKFIASYAFRGNKSLCRVRIPEGVWSVANSAFEGCTSLEEVMLPSTLTQIENNAFDGCTSLKEIILPEGMDPDGLGPWAFTGCAALKHVYLPDSIRSLAASVFDGCSSLTSIHLPEDLTHLDMWSLASTGLVSVEIPEGVDYLPNCVFYNCGQLETVLIPDSVDSIDETAFDDCNSLKFVRCNIGSFAEKWARENGYTVLPLDMEIVDGVLVKYTGYASELNIPSDYGITAVGKKDGSGAFEGNTSVRSITLPSGVTRIGSYAFQASNIENVRLSGGLKTIENSAFMGCVRLTQINLPDGTQEIGVTAFYNCAELAILDVPDSVTSIGTEAFEGCKKLTLIVGKDSKALEYAIANNIPYRIRGERLAGDANGDGTVNMKDALLILQSLRDPSMKVDAYSADVTGDGKADMADALLIMQYDAGWNVALK